MASFRIRRQAVTSKGIVRRLRDWDADRVSDPRVGPKFPLPGVLRLVVLTLLSAGNSQREVEARSEQLDDEAVAKLLGLPHERIADNTIGTLLPRLSPTELRGSLHHGIKAEARRGTALAGTVGGRRVVALDGKVLAPVRMPALMSAARGILAGLDDERASDPTWSPDVRELRRVLELGGLSYVQLVQPRKGEVYGLVRQHRWTLTCGNAAVTVDERPIPGRSNEIGSAVESYEQLMLVYGRTKLFDTVTADAGNTSLAFATALDTRSMGYFLAVKGPNGDIHHEAISRLEQAEPLHCESRDRCGKAVVYSVYAAATEHAWHGWEHAKQVVRIERVVCGDDGEQTVGNRYFVTNLSAEELSPAQALAVCRSHWRCENEGHWTADTVFNEDAHRAPLSRHPKGMLVASLLRCVAQNLLAVLRALSRGVAMGKPTWRAVRQHVLAVVFRPVLDTAEFEAFAA